MYHVRHSPVTPHENNLETILRLALTFQKPTVRYPVFHTSHAIMKIERESRCEAGWTRIRAMAAEPRMHVRSKNNNPFAINKTTHRSRACMCGFSNSELALFGTGSPESHPFLAKFGRHPVLQPIWLCLAFFHFWGSNCQSRQFQSQFNLMSRLSLATGGNLGLK